MTHEYDAADESMHPEASFEEWVFSWWTPDASIAGWTMYRLVPRHRIWYCFGLVGRNRPVLHVAEFDITRRADPMIAKAESFWAEFFCDAPFDQWTLGNETYAVELDDPAEGLGRAYGRVVPVASDLEWYADGPTVAMRSGSHSVSGYEQCGVLLGTIETEQGPIEIPEVVAHRSHRWSVDDIGPSELANLDSPALIDDTGRPLRLAFRLPDDSVWDAVLTEDGFRAR
ncbi:MAG: hypothetical protein ACKOYO_08010 [Actinomycetota bacterium]